MADATTLLTTQIGAAAACTYLLDVIKKWSKIPWVTEHTPQINAAIRAVLALGATVGINAAWNPAEHSLLITGLSLATVAHGAWHWFTQYALTHLAGTALEKGTYPAPEGSKSPVT